MPNIEIDGQKIEVPEGATVMDAADRLGIYIPRFCYHRKLSVAANCRMCLVEVEKAPKPLPACATPVTDGMKVWTRSGKAHQAQQGVMEFLLINHPLDCPICDQGGECQLQDLAVGFGRSSSRYREEKRVVLEKNLGPLIATDMTRCIHCTRCVRFGQEIAGIMELGQVGRGEHAEIMPFVASTVDSELSGNMIDLCPVGALTSKPFRYTARPWELSRRFGVSPHDGLGSNLVIQVKRDRVMRVLPRENEAVNECWLADRDRFSYQALRAEDRLTRPMLRGPRGWVEVDWQTALGHAAERLKEILARQGAHAVGGLASPHSTLEELYLFQKLLRGLGSPHVDHRLRHADFRADGLRRGAPWLGMPVAELSTCDAVLLIGSTLRKEQPLLAHRLRQAVKAGGRLAVVHAADDDLLCSVAAKAIVPPSRMPALLGEVLVAVAERQGAGLASPYGEYLAGVRPTEVARAVASTLAGGRLAVLMGAVARYHPQAALLESLAQEIARILGARFGWLMPAANEVGAHLAGVWPGPDGLDAGRMLREPRHAYLLFNTELELDVHDPVAARAAMAQAGCVIAFTPFRHAALDYAEVLLPIAPFAETSGSFVNMEGRVQSFAAAVPPLGDARPGWKVLRVLANLLGLSGFGYDSSEAVRAECLGPEGEVATRLDNTLRAPVLAPAMVTAGLERLGEVPIYQLDMLTRRSPALQATKDGALPRAFVHPSVAARLGLKEGETVWVRQGHGEANLPLAVDARLAEACVRIPAAHPLTQSLGSMFGTIEVERAG